MLIPLSYQNIYLKKILFFQEMMKILFNFIKKTRVNGIKFFNQLKFYLPNFYCQKEERYLMEFCIFI